MQSGLVDELREPLFDTITADAGAVLPSTINMFTVGQNDTKGPELTNMTANGELPSPERMSVYGIRMAFFNTVEADVDAIIRGYCVRLVVSGKAKFTAPIEYCAAGGGLYAGTAVQNGLPSKEAGVMFPEGYQIDIEAGQRFSLQLVARQGVTLAADPDGTGLFLRAMLDGLHSVPVN